MQRLEYTITKALDWAAGVLLSVLTRGNVWLAILVTPWVLLALCMFVLAGCAGATLHQDPRVRLATGEQVTTTWHDRAEYTTTDGHPLLCSMHGSTVFCAHAYHR